MVKSIIKEIIVILLLLLAIILALGILFYDYIPTNKTVPTVATYTTSTNVSQELNEQITEDETVLVTYQINATDLSTYENTNEYTKGKVNPFSTYDTNTVEETNTNTTSNSSSNTNVSSGNSSNSNTNTNTNSTNTNTNTNTTNNTFYNNTGTK